MAEVRSSGLKPPVSGHISEHARYSLNHDEMCLGPSRDDDFRIRKPTRRRVRGSPAKDRSESTRALLPFGCPMVKVDKDRHMHVPGPCTDTRGITPTMKALTEHLKKQHSREYRCLKCHKWHKSAEDLDLHRKPQLGMFQCDTCCKEFERERDHDEHRAQAKCVLDPMTKPALFTAEQETAFKSSKGTTGNKGTIEQKYRYIFQKLFPRHPDSDHIWPFYDFLQFKNILEVRIPESMERRDYEDPTGGLRRIERDSIDRPERESVDRPERQFVDRPSQLHNGLQTPAQTETEHTGFENHLEARQEDPSLAAQAYLDMTFLSSGNLTKASQTLVGPSSPRSLQDGHDIQSLSDHRQELDVELSRSENGASTTTLPYMETKVRYCSSESSQDSDCFSSASRMMANRPSLTPDTIVSLSASEPAEISMYDDESDNGARVTNQIHNMDNPVFVLIETGTNIVRAWLTAYLQRRCPQYLSGHTAGETSGSGRGHSIATASEPEYTQVLNQSRLTRKRDLNPDESDERDDGDDRGRKRRSQPSDRADGQIDEDERLFACPFQKRRPEEYRYWAGCRNGWTQVSQIKQHLERTHRIFQCIRCGEGFAKDAILKKHQRQPESCTVRTPVPPVEGINDEVAERLKPRKGLCKLDEHGKWWKVYQALFPHELPDPDMHPYLEVPGTDPVVRGRHEAYLRYEFLNEVHQELGASVRADEQEAVSRLMPLLGSTIQTVWARHLQRAASVEEPREILGIASASYGNREPAQGSTVTLPRMLSEDSLSIIDHGSLDQGMMAEQPTVFAPAFGSEAGFVDDLNTFQDFGYNAQWFNGSYGNQH